MTGYRPFGLRAYQLENQEQVGKSIASFRAKNPEYRIVNVARAIHASAAQTVDAARYLLAPPFVDAHFHMDATLSHGLPRVNQSGTLLEGIALWGELKPTLTQEAIVERALAYCDWAVAKGLLAIRSHVDVCDPRLLAVEAAFLDATRAGTPVSVALQLSMMRMRTGPPPSAKPLTAAMVGL